MVQHRFPTSVSDLVLVHATLSDIGCRRERNEDAAGFFGSEDPVGTFLQVIADGVGGNAAGDVASRLAIRSVNQSFFRDGSPDDLAAALLFALEEANRVIRRQAESNPEQSGMATTCTAAAIRNCTIQIAHVGDCRAYLNQGAVMTQLTNDHSLAAEYERRGKALPAARESLANVLTRCLGGEAELAIDLHGPIKLSEEDSLLLCSDGLNKVVEDKEIQEVVSSLSPEIACRQLVDLARDRGAPDNVTVQVTALLPA